MTLISIYPNKFLGLYEAQSSQGQREEAWLRGKDSLTGHKARSHDAHLPPVTIGSVGRRAGFDGFDDDHCVHYLRVRGVHGQLKYKI